MHQLHCSVPSCAVKIETNSWPGAATTRSSLPIHPKALFHKKPNCFSVCVHFFQPHNTHIGFSQSTQTHHLAAQCQVVLSRSRAVEQMFQQERADAGHGIAPWHHGHAQQLICHTVSSSGLLVVCAWCVLHSVYSGCQGSPYVNIWCIRVCLICSH